MRPQTTSQTGTGAGNWIPLDYKQAPFNVGFGISVSGTATYDIEHTFDDIFDSSVTPTVFKHGTLVSQTTNKDGNYAFPIRAVRINITAGTGTVSASILQGLR